MKKSSIELLNQKLNALQEHSLSVVVPAHASVPVFLLHKKNTSDLHIYLVFAPSNIGITGDIPFGENQHGVWSSSVCGLEWFINPRPAWHLCSKFLKEKYDAAETEKAVWDFLIELKESMKEKGDRGLELDSFIDYVREVDDIDELHDINQLRKGISKICRNRQSLNDFIEVVQGLSDCVKVSYGEEGLWLVAVQQIFSALYIKHIKEKTLKSINSDNLPRL